MTLKEQKAFSDKLEKFINDAVDGLEKDIAVYQRRLFESLTEKLIQQLEQDKGRLTKSEYNFRLINQYDQLMKDFTRQFGQPIIKDMSDKMLEVMEMTNEYILKQPGMAANTFATIQKNSNYIYDYIGIKPNGDIIQGGYLSKLAEMPEVQAKLRDYITNNVVSGSGIKEFQKGFKAIIQGTPELPAEIIKYYRTYSFDLFGKVSSAINNVFAEEVGLKYFIYFGSIMKNSRCFCIKRAGKVFHVDDTKDWKEDPTLISYYQKNPYNPLIDKGGFNCRHNIVYISEANAKRQGYDKANAQKIVNESCTE